jgi:hypothetical protein
VNFNRSSVAGPIPLRRLHLLSSSAFSADRLKLGPGAHRQEFDESLGIFPDLLLR